MRILLVNPPSPERLGAPLLGQQSVASALLRHGCEVRVIDAAARGVDSGSDELVAEAEGFDPDLVGIGLFTRWVERAYALAARLRGRVPLLVAGGPHATVRPAEALARGFDLVVRGEAERAIVDLVACLEGGSDPGGVAGLVYRRPDGTAGHGPPPEPIHDLDALAPALLAQGLYRPEWYGPPGRVATPGGMLTSRGCPAHCTFCANHVTGRTFRWRQASQVVAELNAYHDLTGVDFFPFWDDALTANVPRLKELCLALERDVRFPLRWSAITRASMVRPELLNAMKRAGLLAVNFGVESGDDAILRSIRKGVRTSQVVRALEWAKDTGLLTTCNFMLGFPQDTPPSLERTLRFMERIAPLVDNFSTLGVVIPFPGTPLYQEHHVRYGFTEWWLQPAYARFAPAPPIDDAEAFRRDYVDDPTLELDFFRYDEEVRSLIRACLRFKAEHNLARMGFPGEGGLTSDGVGSPGLIAAT